MIWIAEIDPLWAGVIGALGGVLLTGLFNLGAAYLTDRWQKKNRREERIDRLRDERAALRRAAYARFTSAGTAVDDFLAIQPPMSPPVSSMDDLPDAMSAMRNANPEIFDEVNAAGLNAKLLAGDEVLALIDAWTNALAEDMARFLMGLEEEEESKSDALFESLLVAMRAEQQADLSIDPKRDEDLIAQTLPPEEPTSGSDTPRTEA